MAEPTLAVLLRNGPHTSASVRYALKCSDIAISASRTPIQIPFAGQSPELFDLGYVRPSITLTGIVDTIGGNTSNEGANSGDYQGTAGMSSFTYLRASTITNDGGNAAAKPYFLPYKNALEEACNTWIFDDTGTPLELEIGDASYPIASFQGNLGIGSSTRFIVPDPAAYYHATGGAIYKVAIQQARFQLNAAREDRYDFSMQFISEFRFDIQG